MAVNLSSAFYVTRLAVPLLRATRGVIVNISSTAGSVWLSPPLTLRGVQVGAHRADQNLGHGVWPGRHSG